MRALVDASASKLLTKYEMALDTVHKRLHDQQVRDQAVDDVQAALERAGVWAMVADHWANAMRCLNEAHPLNPRIMDAENAIKQLGGMQLHLTSRKRKLAAAEDDEGAPPLRPAEQARLHEHSDAHFLKRLEWSIHAAAACLANGDAERGVWTLDGALLVEADAGEFGNCAPGAGKIAYDAAANKVYRINEHNEAFTADQNNRAGIAVAAAGLKPALCHVSLVQPAMAGASAKGNIFTA